jgi:hypothetical protein
MKRVVGSKEKSRCLSLYDRSIRPRCNTIPIIGNPRVAKPENNEDTYKPDCNFCSTACVRMPEMSGELNRSMQHWLEVYSPGFQSPRSFAGVDLGAELPC